MHPIQDELHSKSGQSGTLFFLNGGENSKEDLDFQKIFGIFGAGDGSVLVPARPGYFVLPGEDSETEGGRSQGQEKN